MCDPFAFDPSRVRKEQLEPLLGMPFIRFTYPLPNGEVLKHSTAEFAGGGGSSAIPNGLDARAYPLYVQFKEAVAGLSAHQRLAWVVAWVREQRKQNPPGPPTPDEDVYEAFGS